MGFFNKISAGLSRTRNKVSQEIQGAVGKGKLTEETLEDIEALLIGADICVEVTAEIIDKIRKACLGKDFSSRILIEQIEIYLTRYLLQGEEAEPESRPHVILVLGVNGVGKTTSIAKLAHHHKSRGKSILVAAGDTFRAGAIEQLEIWCQRASVGIVKHQEKSDAASVVYDAYAAAKARNCDYLIIDTAGRLHNKAGLMDELKKIVRVLQKHNESLPHETFLVLDGNTGQNAIPQAKSFHDVHPISGFIITKLDGTAKGGALISISHEMNIPVRYIGVGEGLDDLVPFSVPEYVKGMFEGEQIAVPLHQQVLEGNFRKLVS